MTVVHHAAMRRYLAPAVLVLAVVWHSWAVIGHWTTAVKFSWGLDFSSYYYALQVALDKVQPSGINSVTEYVPGTKAGLVSLRPALS